MNHTDGIDECAIDLIASRVPKALRDEPADIAAGLGARSTAESALTVDAVAERLDVSRSPSTRTGANGAATSSAAERRPRSASRRAPSRPTMTPRLSVPRRA
jgi:hypothetical protein